MQIQTVLNNLVAQQPQQQLTINSGTLNSLQIGQVLKGTIVDQISVGTVALRIGDNLVKAQTNMATIQGQNLSLEVIKAGDTPILKILSSASNQINESALSADSKTVQQMLRQSLPIQSGLPALTANLVALAKLDVSETKLSPEILRLVKQIVDQFPTLLQMQDSQSMKTVLQNSGIFLEAQLLKLLTATLKDNTIDSNLKTNLLRLATQLRAQLSQVEVEPGTKLQQLPNDLSKLAERIFQQMPHAIKRVNPEGIRQVIQETVRFLEQRLQNLSTNAKIDLKTELLFIVSQLKSVKPLSSPLLPLDLLTSAPTESHIKATLAGNLAMQGDRLLKQLPETIQNLLSDNLKVALKETAGFFESRLNQLMQTVPPHLVVALRATLLRIIERAKTSDQGGKKTAPATKTNEPNPPLRGTALQPQPKAPPSINLGGSAARTMNMLLQQTEGALARLQMTQLTSLQDNDSTKQVWNHEIPVRNGDQTDLFQIRIEQDKQKEEGEESEDDKENWTVTLTFDLDGLGPMYTRLIMADDTLSTVLWAEKEKTVTLVNQQLPRLEKNYTKAGLNIGHVICHKGKPPEPVVSTEHDKLLNTGVHLVDEKA